jgi:GNAT superfamily N-acetyltransferase
VTGGADVRVRAARSGEAQALTALVLRSKAHWGYDPEFMVRAEPELRVTEDDLERLVVLVAERDATLAGMGSLDPETAPPALAHLFVDPASMGAGVGRVLLAALVGEARARGIRELEFEADPNAEAFYARQGARTIGERASSSTGRSLPLMRLEIDP